MTTPNTASTLPIRFGGTVWQLPTDGIASTQLFLPAVNDIQAEVNQALSNTIGFSSVDQLIVAGDVVALAVDACVPDLPRVVSAVARWLVEHGVPIENLRIVFAGNEQQLESLTQSISQSSLVGIRVERHDADDVNCVSYVAADEEAQAIYINRVLVDADVVIPITCARNQKDIDYLGAFSLFPLLSNRETRGQLLNYGSLVDCENRQSLIERSDQAAWWLGLLVGIQVIPSVNNQIAAVLCGLLNTVNEAAHERMSSVPSIEQSYDLVVACIDEETSSWYQLAHALHLAAGHCSSGGAIVLCTEMSEPIGPALRRLKDGQSSREQIAKRIAKDHSDDALAAGAIFETTKDRHVYFVSKHRNDTVESLGMGVLDGEEQLMHIVRQHSRYLVIHSAQHA